MIHEEKVMTKEMEKRFLELIDKNQEKLYRMAFSYVKNKEDALEVVQEAVYKGYISYHKVRNSEYENTWLVRILINCAIDFVNRSKKIISMENAYVENSIESEVRTVNDKLAIEKALECLNEKQRAVVILRYFEDMTLEQISEILEMPVNTVKSVLYRALKKLRIDLEEVV